MILIITGYTEAEDEKWLIQIDREFQKGKFEEVADETKAYLNEYPNSYKGLSLQGWTYIKLNELEKAENCFDKAIRENENCDNAYVGKGVVYRKKGDLKKARDYYHKAIGILPSNPEAFSSLLVIEVMEESYEKAVEYGSKAWSLRKDDPTIPANLAVAYHYLGDIEKRDSFYNHAQRLGYYNLNKLKELFEK